MIKKVKKNILPTYPNFFEHVTPNTYVYFLGLMQIDVYHLFLKDQLLI